MTEEFALRASFDVEHLPVAPVYYRVLHDAELPEGIWRPNLPEVWPLNGEVTRFGESWQYRDKSLNPAMTGGHWRSVHASNRAFNNGQGFNDAAEPHADYVNRLDLTSPDPAWDKTRCCGGATLRGIEQPPYLIVDILDGFSPPPSLDYFRAHPWLYFHAVNSTENGITRFPQGDGLPVLVPLVGSGVARIPLNVLQRVPGIADPYVMGYQPSPYTNLF